MIKKLTSFFKEDYKRNRLFTFSNSLTISRFILCPLVVSTILNRSWFAALFLFGIASLTDFFDGFCARYFNTQSLLGACLDPLADKCLILSSFTALALLRYENFVVPLWLVFFFFLREFVIVVGTILLAIRGESLVIQPTMWGKATTALQVVFIVWLLVCFLCGWHPYKTYSFSLMFLVLFSLFSLLHYCRMGIRTARSLKK